MKKKRIACVGIAALSVLCLSSCIMKNKDLTINRDLSYTFTEEDWTKVTDEMDRFEDAIKNDGSQFDVYGAWNSLNRDAYAIASYREIEYIHYCMGDSTAYDKYTEFQDKLNEIVKFEESMYQPIYDSSYKDEFFKDYTEEEIQELLNSVHPDEYYELEDENEKLLASYREDMNNNDYSNVNDTYLALVKNYEKEASICGYDDYMTYCYKEIYSRDYTPEEVETFNGYIRDYIVPLMEETENKLSDLYHSATTEEQNTYSDFTTSYYNAYKDLFTEYASFVGDDFSTSYDHLWSEGYLMEGNKNTQAVDGAFTAYLYIETLDQPIIYLGAGYQDIMTIVHEFGHYNAFMVNGSGVFSYDLAETQSQGDEALFTAWITANNKFSENVLELIRYNKIYDACQTMVLASAVNAFEYQVYHKSDLKASDLDGIYEDVLDSLGGYEKITKMIYGSVESAIPYWKRTCLDNAGYYISYAMSYVPTLEIYEEALSDISQGKKIYKNIYKYSDDYDGEDFRKIVVAAGLTDPFDEETFKTISRLGN